MFALLLSFKQGALLNISPAVFIFMNVLDQILGFEKRLSRVGGVTHPQLAVGRGYTNIYN